MQKSALKIILQDKYTGYKNALNKLNIQTLSERRQTLNLNFALKCVKNPKTQNMFPLNIKNHKMESRYTDKYKVQHANTERLKKSSIIYMQNLLNEHEEKSTNHS